jgi:hypothetical protein
MRIFLLSLLLSGCSLVQYMPSADCSHVKYERWGNEAMVIAEGCQV